MNCSRLYKLASPKRLKGFLMEGLKLIINLFFWLPSKKIDREFFEKPFKIFYTIVVLVFVGGIAAAVIRFMKDEISITSTIGLIMCEVLLIFSLKSWNKLRPWVRYIVLDIALTLGITITMNYNSDLKIQMYKEGTIDPLTSYYEGNATAWFGAVMVMLLNNRILGLFTLFYRYLLYDDLNNLKPGVSLIYSIATFSFFSISFARRYFEHKTFRKINNLFQEQTDHLAINNILEEGIVIIKRDGTIPFSNVRAKDILQFKTGLLASSLEISFSDSQQYFLVNPKSFNSQIEDKSQASFEEEFSVESIVGAQIQRLKQLEGGKIVEALSEEKFEKRKGKITVGGKEKWLEVKTRLILHNDELALLLVIHEITDKVENVRLKEIDEYKDKLLAVVTHELRTPLNCIIPMINSAIGDPSVSENVRISTLGPCLRSAKLLHNLVNDILDYYQIKHNKIRLAMVNFNLRDTLEEIRQLFVLQAQMKGLHLDIDIDDEIPSVIYGEPNRISQILNNLISNAIKFTPKSGRVIVKAEIIPREGLVRFKVCDSGPGLSESSIKNLFSDITGKGSTNYSNPDMKTNPTGIGIGMSISNYLATLLGGRGIQVLSEIGVGSTFSFDIPLTLRQPTNIFKSESRKEIREGEIIVDLIPDGNMKCQCRKVLIVDDNMYNILALKTQLAPFRLTIYQAFDGVEAVEFMQTVSDNVPHCDSWGCQPIKVIFMDVDMPRLNGLQATEKIKSMTNKEVGCKSVPIVLCTAHNDAETKAKGIQAGVEMMLTKPVNPELLKKVIEVYI